MDDINVFERLVADEMQRRAGPDPVVDDAAIFSAITATQSPKWRFQSMFSATKSLVAGAILALVGGFLLAAVLTQLGLVPKAFILVIMFAASTSFSTPVGYQTNTMVFGPGGYKFLDFTRVGAPLSLLMAIVVPIYIYLFWGL